MYPLEKMYTPKNGYICTRYETVVCRCGPTPARPTPRSTCPPPHASYRVLRSNSDQSTPTGGPPSCFTTRKHNTAGISLLIGRTVGSAWPLVALLELFWWMLMGSTAGVSLTFCSTTRPSFLIGSTARHNLLICSTAGIILMISSTAKSSLLIGSIARPSLLISSTDRLPKVLPKSSLGLVLLPISRLSLQYCTAPYLCCLSAVWPYLCCLSAAWSYQCCLTAAWP